MAKTSSIILERFDSVGAIGYVDREASDGVVTLRLVRDGEVLSEGRAELFRPDTVANQKSRHINCGFALPVPADKIAELFGKADIVLEDGSVIALASEQKPAVNDAGIPAQDVLAQCDHPFFGIDGYIIQDGILKVAGILLPPQGRFGDLECVGQKGVSFKFNWPMYLPGAQPYYWYYPGSPYLGFLIEIDLGKSSNRANSFEFYFKIRGEDEKRSRLRNISVPKDLRAYQNFPSDFNVKRVQEQSSTVAAAVAGYTDYKRIVEIASRHVALGPDTRFLDWGCGFGRVCRHFQGDFPTSKVIGVELDELNLNWMSENFPHITPVKTTTEARIGLPDGSADVIYGISVMTHIRIEQQGAWLKELKRILAPGGVMILTTSGPGAVAFSSQWITPEHLETWTTGGYLEHKHGSEFDHDIGGDNYYIQTRQRIENTRRHWGDIVEIVDYIPSVFGYQDAVVMR